MLESVTYKVLELYRTFFSFSILQIYTTREDSSLMRSMKCHKPKGYDEFCVQREAQNMLHCPFIKAVVSTVSVHAHFYKKKAPMLSKILAFKNLSLHRFQIITFYFHW